MFTNKEKVYLIGIGGIGMSGLAQILLGRGCKVSGSDLKSSALIKKLKKLGAEIVIGHSSDNVKKPDLIIYSAAIKENNPELLIAHSLGIPTLTRAEALAKLANRKRSIAVSGSHGKTTTASLISHLLVESGLRPTVCVGGELFSLNGNAFLGEGHYFVLEADESDGSLLNLNPVYSVVTNIDREHLDYYRDLEHIGQTLRRFMNNTKEEGCIFFCQDELGLRKIVHSLQKRSFSYGFSAQAHLYARDIEMQAGMSKFNCIYKREKIGEISLRIPGRHNVCNTLAAVAVGLELGLKFNSIRAALGSYTGVRRRLQLKLDEKDILIFEDYAHHPTEIKASLAALKTFVYKRLLVVFQPHRYTRTKFLINDFGHCFQAADYLIVTDIYPASEIPIAGIGAENICQKARQANIEKVYYLSKEQIVEHLLGEITAGDLIVIMGAGDIGNISDALAEKIKG